MRNLKAGISIKSTALLNGSFFEETSILIVEHDEAGTTGFVTNKPFGKSLNDLIEGGKQLTNGLYLGGNMEQVIEAINNGSATQEEIQLFIGYCGWDVGELEAEMEEGSWNF